MGSSSEEPNKGIDASVGGLVWVRRRNGSWWPGRILGPDELPEGCLPTLRSGTPVKLLGREDASVDWYNLDKSKRVKSFRCGEYDSCIEKAKASALNLSKKTVKYARREDAILQALELESARLGKDSPDFYAIPDTQSGEHHHDHESPASFHPSEDAHLDVISSENDSDSALELSQSGVSFEEPDHLDANKEKSRRRRTPNDSEDDGTEGVKRMRGLEDLGMGVSSSLKRKRSQITHVHEFLKRKNRRRTLTKVLECTAMVSDPVREKPTGLSVPGASDSKVSGLESNESKKNNSTVITNNSDSTGVSCENGTSLNASKPATDASFRYKLKENEISSMLEVPNNETSKIFFDVPFVTEEKHSAGLSGAPLKAHGGAGAQSSQSSHVDTISLGNEEHNESGSTSSGTANIHNMSQRIEKGTSEWQLKGKRNARSRKIDVNDEAETYLAGTDREGNCGWSWNAHTRESTTEFPVPQRLLPFRQSRFTVNPKYDSSDFSLRHHIVGSGLFDVPVEVKSSHRPQHVPYVSLMSKLHGQPITGHSLTIEVLDDGFCNDLISTHECHCSSSELDGKLNASVSTHVDMVYERKQRGRPSSKPRTSRKKSQKSRKNGLLSKKIRKLSSLTISHRQNKEGKKPVAAKLKGPSIALKGPSIACVPLTVVFSRINAALNSSTRAAPRLTATSNI